jgi:CHAD domain-containing protein
MGRVLEPVRDLAVADGLLGEWVGNDRAREDAVAGLRRHLLVLGAAARQRMSGQLGAEQAATLDGRLQAVGSQLALSTTGAWSRTLSLRMTKRAQHLRETVETAGSRYLPVRLRAVRVATEKLRYAFEFARDAGSSRRLAPVQRLTEVQDVLDRLHDIEVLIRLIEDAAQLPDTPWIAHQEEVRRELEQECFRLHGEFAGQRRHVMQTCGAAFDIAVQLWNRRDAGGAQATPLKMTLPDTRVPRPASNRRAASSSSS